MLMSNSRWPIVSLPIKSYIEHLFKAHNRQAHNQRHLYSLPRPEEESESTEWETDTDASDEEEEDSEQVCEGFTRRDRIHGRRVTPPMATWCVFTLY